MLIYIVDGDSQNVREIRKLMEQRGHTCQAFSDVAKAHVAFTAAVDNGGNAPGFIICGEHPEDSGAKETGMEFLRWLRSNNHDVSFILLATADLGTDTLLELLGLEGIRAGYRAALVGLVPPAQ